MGLFDRLKKTPADNHKHEHTVIPERVEHDGKTYLRKDYRDGISLDVLTDYSFLEDRDQITFKEDAGKVHAYFDDSVDVGIVRAQDVIDAVYNVVERGGFYISNINPNTMTLRIGFYEPADKDSLKPAKTSITFTAEDFFTSEGEAVGLIYDEYEGRYSVEDELQTITLSEAQSGKIESYINKGYDNISAVVVGKEVTDSLKTKVKLEIRFE